MTEAALACAQAVSPDDDCCGPDGTCNQPATWVHPATGLLLCDLHEGNARQWASGGTWRVGRLDVSYPDGWERLPEPEVESPALEVVRFDRDGSGPTIEIG